MTLYTNLKPLFEARKNSEGTTTEYFYVGMQFFRLYDDDAWFKRISNKRFNFHDHGWSNDLRSLAVYNTPDVTETHMAQCLPDMLCQMMEDDVLFPSVLPHSKHFNSVPEKFYGLAVRDVKIIETKFDFDNSGDWAKLIKDRAPQTQVHDCVELLIDQDKVVCFKSDLTVVRS